MSRPGFALPVALLLMLAVTAVAHGALLLARGEAAASRLAASLLARELAVRGALAAAARADSLPAIPVGAEAALPAPAHGGLPVRVRVVRLSGELHLLRAEASATAASAAGLVVWALDPASRAASMGGTGEPAAPYQGPPPPAHPDCVEAGLGVAGVTAAPASALARSPPPGLGLLPPEAVRARADALLGGSVAPSPGTDAWSCPVHDPLNWGAATDPHHPCADHRPLVASEGDLVVEGGEGQGVLAVEGDLTLRGTTYHGLVLAGGRVELAAGARVRGAVRSGAGVDPPGSVTADACAVFRALRDARGLRAPLPLPDGPWIRPL